MPGSASSASSRDADRVQRDGRGGRVLDHCDVQHERHQSIDKIFVKLRSAAMKIVLAGGIGAGRAGAARARSRAHEVVVLSRSGGVRWDGRTLGAVGARARGRGRGDQPRGPHRRLPLHAGQPARDHGLAAASRRACWARRSSAARCRRACGCSRARRRSTPTTTARANDERRRDRRRRAGRAGHVAVLDRRRARAGRRPRPARRVRTVLMRSAMVMSPDRGGVFDTLYGLVRRGLGGRAAGGAQYVSWIHDEDFARAIRLLIARRGLRRPGEPVARRTRCPTRSSCARCARPRAAVGLPATRWMLEARRVLHAHRDGAGAQEPPRRAGPPARRRLRVRVPGVAGGGAGPRQSTRLSAATVASLDTARTSSGTPRGSPCGSA